MRHPVLIASTLICGMAGTLAIAHDHPPKSKAATGVSAAATPAEAQTPVGASAEVKPTQGNKAAGTLSLIADKDAVRIAGTITGLTANGEHGFHVHEKGDCSAPDASSAGGHFNPSSQPHGNPAGPAAHHVGDVPSIKADAQGTAKVDVRVTGATLGTSQPNDIAGKAIVVHEKPDDYKSQPAGNAGSRIACGVIK